MAYWNFQTIILQKKEGHGKSNDTLTCFEVKNFKTKCRKVVLQRNKEKNKEIKFGKEREKLFRPYKDIGVLKKKRLMFSHTNCYGYKVLF